MGIDCGGTVSKASVFDLDGRELSSCGRTMSIINPQPDRYERDVPQVKRCTFEAIRGALQKAGISGSEIAGIGLTGQANGLYMFKKDGTPVGHGILSSDARAKAMIRRWTQDGTIERLIPILKETVYVAQTPVLMSWLAANDPELLNASEVCTTVKEYIRFLLTERWAMELTEATVLSLMDQDRMQISDTALEAFGILEYKNRFPHQFLNSDEIGGYVNAKAAEQTGLTEGTPVVGGLFDCTANTISQGVIREDQLCIVAGTWGMNNMITKEMIYSERLFGSYVYCLPGYRQIMEGSSTSCSNLEWIVNNIMKQSGQNFCGYDELNRMIAEDSAPRNSIFFLPFMYGTNVNLDAKSAFIGLTGFHRLPDLLRAVYEGVVFAHMYHIERLLRFVQPPRTIRASGGSAKSDVWMQMFADALGKEVEVSEAEEMGTLGCAMMAGVGAGCYRDIYEAVEKCVHIRKVYEPNAEYYQYYQDKYRSYCTLLEALDPLWKTIDTFA